MAALTSLDQADGLVSSRINDRTWQNAYSMRKPNGTIAIRFQRWLPNSSQKNVVTDVTQGTFDSQNTIGAWDETTDDSTT
jgi:hypothetical protein